MLARYRGLRLSITTKSALITRDLDLLRRLDARSQLTVQTSLVTVDKALARQLEPGAPTPERRLQTVRTLSAAGIEVGVFALPILPGINDSEAQLRKLLVSARRSGADWINVGPLWLASAGRRRFLQWLKQVLPEQLPRYRRLFSRGVDVDPSWRQRLRERVGRVRAEVGIPAGPDPRQVAPPAQLGLPWAS